jgi:hypothetical protein
MIDILDWYDSAIFNIKKVLQTIKYGELQKTYSKSYKTFKIKLTSHF